MKVFFIIITFFIYLGSSFGQTTNLADVISLDQIGEGDILEFFCNKKLL